MKILFLDMDGVANSERWLHARGCTTSEIGTRFRRDNPVSMIDPAAVQRLNLVISATGAVCVLSSAWRIVHQLDKMQGYLEQRGFIGKLIDRTPSGKDMPPGEIVYGTRRGMEIQAWLDMPLLLVGQTGTVLTRGQGIASTGGRIAIVDDSADMGHLLPYLVRTTWMDGLQDEHVEPLIKMLGGRP